MNKSLLLALIIGTLALTGCAGHSKVIVDTQGLNIGMYQKDLAECQELADQVESNVVEGIIGGAIVGAIIGAVINSDNKVHHNRHNNRRHNRHYYKPHNTHSISTASTAKIGAVSGGLLAGSGAMQKRNRVMKNCITDRGYRILN